VNAPQIVVVGGGAAGFFGAITCAEACPGARITVLEKSPQFLAKVRISGGGRCNVTHACFDPRELSQFYPRGGAALRGPFQRFQPRDTIAWFESHGVRLKIEPDGRVFPQSDSSQTIMDCLLGAARAANVELRPHCGPAAVNPSAQGGFDLTLPGGGLLHADRLLLATGGCRAAIAGEFALALGHTLESPVPSLFTFHLAVPWLRELAGISVPDVQASLPAQQLRERGPLLITHAGLSGPVILRLSAWGARVLHDLAYQFALRINWLPALDEEPLGRHLDGLRSRNAAKLVVNTPLPPLPSRLWHQLVLAAGLAPTTRWAECSRAQRHRLIQQLRATELLVQGKTLNQEEFVTCGGVRLGEVNFRTMESRLRPGLFFAGEILDIDGLTGGFNFQSAWTTGRLAGLAMAGRGAADGPAVPRNEAS